MNASSSSVFTLRRSLLGVAYAVACIGLLFVFYRTGLAKPLKWGLLSLELAVGYAVFRSKVWKEFSVCILAYVLIAGLLMPVPRLIVVHESIRNQYFHVPMWFSMILLLLGSVSYSIAYLSSSKLVYDVWAASLAKAGLLFGVLGISTGSLWAGYTWGSFWHGDPKQVGAAIGLLIYFAYLVLRSSFTDDIQRARISAVYGIFAYPSLVVLLYILPRMSDVSLHPGSTGNPAFGKYDLSDDMRLVFYPAVIGWTLLGVWMAQVRTRIEILNQKIDGIYS